MKRFLLLVVLLITLGFGCDGCDDPYENWRQWWQGELQRKAEEDAQYTSPTNSILEDLYPERYSNGNSNSNTSSDASILEDLYPERYSKTTTSLWVNTTDLNINESGTEASWGVQIVEGTDTASTTIPVIGVDVTVEFSGGSGDEEVMALTGSDGWVWWVRTKTRGAEQMYIKDVAGDFPWNSLDLEFWQNTPALSITAEEAK